MNNLLPRIHGLPVEPPDTEAAKLQVWREGLWWAEDVGVLPVWQEAPLLERLRLMLNPLSQVLQRFSLTSNKHLLLLPLSIPFNTDHLGGGSGGEECELLRDEIVGGGQVNQLDLGQVDVRTGLVRRANCF